MRSIEMDWLGGWSFRLHRLSAFSHLRLGPIGFTWPTADGKSVAAFVAQAERYEKALREIAETFEIDCYGAQGIARDAIAGSASEQGREQGREA